ncbi:collagenase-like [Cloeon dipterum]|uniref:collagenase-like n=1 Tax=Cloeon dipterum TaxID=197152 RepID=UPI00322039B0
MRYSKVCVGSLISDSVILITADCLFKDLSSFNITIGAVDYNNYQAEHVEFVDLYGYSYVFHEDYDSVSGANDIAALILKTPIKNPKIKPIRLPSKSQINDFLNRTEITILGWGGETGRTEPNLQHADTFTLNFLDCQFLHGSLHVTDENLCLDNTVPGSPTACYDGDNGSPMITKEKDGQYTLIGFMIKWFVGSEEVGVCNSHIPVIYMRVAAYLDWLAANTGIEIRP